MNNKIIFYNKEGKFDHDDLLNLDTLTRINGMKVRIRLNNNTEIIGFADPYRTLSNDYDGQIHDYINVWVWENIDENNHKLLGDESTKYKQKYSAILINNILFIETILFSNPSLGGKITNKFEI